MGSGSDQNSATLLQGYPYVVEQFYGQRVTQIQSYLYERALSPAEVESEIDAGLPVELGITPSGPFQGQAGHDVVLIGYSATASEFDLVINDPFPYDRVVGPSNNPYRNLGADEPVEGQYIINYNYALQGGLQWSASMLVRPY